MFTDLNMAITFHCWGGRTTENFGITVKEQTGKYSQAARLHDRKREEDDHWSY